MRTLTVSASKFNDKLYIWRGARDDEGRQCLRASMAQCMLRRRTTLTSLLPGADVPTLRSSPRRSTEAGCRLTASAEAADLEAVDDGVGRGVVVGVVGEALVDAEVVRAVVRAADHLDELLVMRDHDELEVGLLLPRLGEG
eukprot:scaffold28362_cov65-Phaeocystis_antarctica.AAC.10